MAQKASSETTDMGNINKIAIKPGHLKEIHQKVRLLNFKTLIDNIPTSIDESSSTVLKYKTPNFRASATLEVAPMTDACKWKIGWIQACTDMTFHNTYSDEGYTSWEFPELTSSTQIMISDCDGHHYPWYGSRNETVTFEGPCKMYQTATVSMNDNFHPHVTWRNPANRSQGPPNLSHITRNQSFYVWLVVWNMSSQKAYVLKTLMWNMQLDILVNPERPLGQRAQLVSDPVPKQPTVLENNVPIPRCALMPPNANSAQMLVWRPRAGKPLCIIPPSGRRMSRLRNRSRDTTANYASCKAVAVVVFLLLTYLIQYGLLFKSFFFFTVTRLYFLNNQFFIRIVYVCTDKRYTLIFVEHFYVY